MKKLTIIIAIVLLSTAVCTAQTVNPAKVKFKGIGLGSTFAQVVKALGNPETDGPATNEECIGGREKDVVYPGISFHMMDGDSKGGKTFEVKSFELTATGYVVSGVKIGDTQATVRRIYGRKFTTDTDPETGETTWLYAMNDTDGPGTTRVVFKNGKVKLIASDYLVC